MFNKNPERDGAPAEAGRPASGPRKNVSGSPSVIGGDLAVRGNLESKGEVRVDGQVDGDIHALRIVIGEGARTTGTLIADAVEIRGSVQGSIRGNTVTLLSSSRVDADVFHKTLTIEQGAFFEGKSRRTAEPLSMPRPANTVLPNS